jgi:uncharacterized protein (TIGR03083 family)
MMQITSIDEVPTIERPESIHLAEAESARFAAALRALDDDGWSARTDCALWDVRDMAGHVLGMVETFSSLRRFARDMRAGGKAAGDGPFIDGLTAVQVQAHAGLSRQELIDRLETRGPVQAAWRGSRRLMRQIRMTQDGPDGPETWKAGYLFDIILTRDTWMHRVDIARATGTAMEVTPDHDGRIVADVVAEWARRHGQPFTLRLTGPAGGAWASGTGGEDIELDAIEFCRILADRETGEGLLSQSVPF